MKRKISKILENKEWGWNYEKVYTRPNIPAKKLCAALKSYAPETTPEKVLILVDDTVFGGAKEGIILSEDGIYSKELFQKRRAISLNDLKNIFAVGQKLLIVNNVEFYNATTVDHIVISSLASRTASILGLHKKNISAENKEANNNEQEGVNQSLDDFLEIHQLTLVEYKKTYQEEGCFSFDRLIDKQVSAIFKRKTIIEKHFNDENKKYHDDKRLNQSQMKSLVVEMMIFMFLLMHHYSLSKINKEFKDALGEDCLKGLYACTLLVYLESFKENFYIKYNHSMNLDDDFLRIIPMMFMDRDGEGFDLNMPREEILKELLSKFNIPIQISMQLISEYDEATNCWINDFVKEAEEEMGIV